MIHQVRARLYRPALIPAWQAYLGAVGAAVVAYPFLPLRVQEVLFVVVGASSAAALARAAVRQPERAVYWWLVAAGVATFTLGQALFTLVFDQRFPSGADA